MTFTRRRKFVQVVRTVPIRVLYNYYLAASDSSRDRKNHQTSKNAKIFFTANSDSPAQFRLHPTICPSTSKVNDPRIVGLTVDQHIGSFTITLRNPDLVEQVNRFLNLGYPFFPPYLCNRGGYLYISKTRQLRSIGRGNIFL